MASKAEVVGVSMDDQRAADDAIRPYQGDLRVLEAYLSYTTGRFNVAQIPDMTDVGIRGSMIQLLRIKVGSSRSAAIGVVSKLMDVDAMLALHQQY